MTLTGEQIAVREKVWQASQRGEPVTLTVEEAKALWRNIFDEAIELRDLREMAAAVKAAEVLAGVEPEPADKM